MHQSTHRRCFICIQYIYIYIYIYIYTVSIYHLIVCLLRSLAFPTNQLRTYIRYMYQTTIIITTYRTIYLRYDTALLPETVMTTSTAGVEKVPGDRGVLGSGNIDGAGDDGRATGGEGVRDEGGAAGEGRATAGGEMAATTSKGGGRVCVLGEDGDETGGRDDGGVV
jgi:hypothetical protein